MQAITTLSQVSPIITSRHLGKKKAKRANNAKSSSILCQGSFEEAAKNLEPTLARYLTPQSVLDNGILNKLKVSYISSQSFFENKHGITKSCVEATEALPTVFVRAKGLKLSDGFYGKIVQGLRNENSFMFDMQVRGFKTNRNIDAERLRNPGLVMRVKDALGK